MHALAKDEDDQVAEDQLGPVALQTYSKAEIAAGYEKLYGKQDKFVKENSAVDMYYRMYIAPEVTAQVDPGAGPLEQGKHLRTVDSASNQA